MGVKPVQAQLIFRLVNNDSDTTTNVKITDFALTAAPAGTTAPTQTTFAPEIRPGATPNFNLLTDVSNSLVPEYGRTSYNADTKLLYTDISIRNTGTYSVNAPLLIAVRNINDPSIVPRNPDGVTPSGMPYYDFSSLVADGKLNRGSETLERALVFYNPNNIQFIPDLVVLAQLNRKPVIDSRPVVEVIAGQQYRYDVNATDPNSDALTYRLLVAPTGMTIDDRTGLITWNTTASNRGNQSIVVEVSDSRGGVETQRYNLSVIDAPPNRPPVFTTTPKTDAVINTEYKYDADATDPDNDNLTYSLALGPEGMTLNPTTGEITWTPGTAKVLGNTVIERIASSSERDTFTFGGVRGDRIYFDSLIGSNSQKFELFTPSGNKLIDSDTNYQGAVILTETGNYSLVVSGTTGEYGFSLIDFNAAPVANFDQNISGVLTPGSEDDAYRFNGNAGQRLYLEVLSSNTNLDWVIYDANNRVIPPITAGNAWGDMEVELPTDGQYVLVLRGKGNYNDNVPYSFRIIRHDTNSTPLTLGTNSTPNTVSGSILKKGEQDVYTFTSTRGTKLYLDTISASAGIHATLISPSGDRQKYFTNHRLDGSDKSLFTLEEDGAYRVVIDGDGATTGAYSFNLLNATVANLINLDTDVSNRLDPGKETHLYRLSTTVANQRLYLDSLVGSPNASWTLYGPSNQIIRTGTLNSDLEATLRTINTYTLAIQSNSDSPIDYQFRVVSHNPLSTPLSFGSTVSSEIAKKREQDIYTFSANADTRLFLDALQESPNINARLVSASGVEVFNTRITSDATRHPVILLENGSYQLIIDGTGEFTGSYSFRLHNLSTATTLTTNTVTTGTLNPGSSTNVFRFAGNAGNRLYLDSQTASPNATWLLYGPGNQLIDSKPLSNDFEVVLPSNGTYYIMLRGDGTATPIDYRIQVVPTTGSPTGLTLGSTYGYSISGLGEQDVYTFDISTSGQRLYFDSTSGSSNIITRLISPSGVSIWSGNASTDSAPILLLETGTHRLIFDGNGDTTGYYSFRLSNLASATSLALSTTISSSLTASETRLYSLNGTAGQRFRFDSLMATQNADWVLYAPDGSIVNQAALSNDFEALLPTSGSYILALRGGSTSTTVNFSFRVDSISSPTGTNSGFGTIRSGSITTGQINNTFTARAGTFVYFDSQISNSLGNGVTARLLDPSSNQVISINAAVDSNLIQLQQSGTYTLRLEGNGEYRYSLIDLNASADLTLNTVTNVPLNPAESRAYKFNGTVGQQIFYDALNSNNPNADVRLFTPGGRQIFSRQAQLDSQLITLSESGTYFLIVSSKEATNTSVNFRLLDNSASGAASLTLDTNVFNSFSNGGLETDLYRFNGTAGQYLYFDSIAGTTPNTWTLYGPSGQQLDSKDLDKDFEIALPSTGQYLLANIGKGGSVTDYQFRVATSTTIPTSISLGSTVNGTISKAGEQDTYTFSGSAGQRLFFDGISDGAETSVRLISPSGTEIFNLRASENRELFTLAETGTYRIVVDAPGTTTGNYSFRLLNAAASTISLDFTYPVTVAANQTQLYTFSGTANQYLYFENNFTGTQSTWTLYGPGNQIITSNNSGWDRELALTASGNYVLALTGPTSGQTNYQFRVLAPVSFAGNITSFGSGVGGSITQFGEQDTYTFTGSVGQRLLLDKFTGTNSIGYQIISPSGAVIYNRLSIAQQLEPFTLNEAGTYRVVIDGDSRSTGVYSFRLVDLAQAANLTLNTNISGVLSQANQAQLYRFTGTRGQHLYFDLLGEWNTNHGTGWALYGPGNQLVASNFNRQSGSSDLEVKLPSDGTYTLMIDGRTNVTTAESFQFRVTTPQALTLGSTVPGSINAAGKQDIYTFDGTAGTRLFFDGLTGSSNITAKLFNPSGREVTTWSTNTDSNQPLSLLETGAYRLVISGSNNAMGSYSFRLVDLETVSTLALNTPVTGRLDPGAEVDFYQFYAAAGQKFNFDLTATQWTNANWVLYGPSGAAIATPSSTSPDFEVTPEKAGTYVLAVRGSSSTPIDYNFRAIRRDIGGTTPTPSTSNNFVLIPGLGEIDSNLLELGTHRVLLEARDGRGGKTEQSFKIRVRPEAGNHNPVIISDPTTIFALNKATYKYKVRGIDPDNDSLAYSLTTAPVGADINASTGEITWSATIAGNYDFSVRVADGRGGVSTQNFRVEVSDTLGEIRGIVWNDLNLNRIQDTNLIQGNAPDIIFVIDATGSTGGRTIDWTTDELEKHIYRTSLGILDTEIASLIAFNQQLIDSGRGQTSRVGVAVLASHIPEILDMDPVTPGVQPLTTAAADKNLNEKLDIRDALTFTGGWDSTFTAGLLKAEEIFTSSETPSSEANIILLSDGYEEIDTSVVERLRSKGINLKAFGIGANAGLSELSKIDPQATVVGSVQELVNIFSGLDGRYVSEPGLASVTVYLDKNNNGVLDGDEQSTVTMADDPTTAEVETGRYSFSNLLPGTYKVRSVMPNGYTQTAPTTGAHTFTITGAKEFRNGNFGLSVPVTSIPNTQPRFTSSAPANAKVGETFEYRALATDPDRDALTYDLSSKPDGMTVNASTGLVVWTPTVEQVGKFDAILRVRDSRGGIDLQYFQVDVKPQNRAPAFTDVAPNTLRPQVGKQLQYQAKAQDLDGDTIIYEIVSNTTNPRLPDGVSINRNTGLVTWTPTDALLGGAFISGLTGVVEPWQILIRATDGKGGEAFQTLNLIVDPARPNSAPRITSTARTSTQLGNTYFYKIEATDTDGDPLTYSLSSAPTGMTINNDVITWIPTANQFGSAGVVLRVADNQGGSDTQSFTILVSNFAVNRAPSITSAPNTVTNIEREYQYNLTGADPDNDLLLWSLDKAPLGMVIDVTTGAISWKPTANQIEEHIVAVRLTDALGQYVGQEFTLNVTGVNTAPQIVSTPITRAAQNQRYTYTVIATDPENDALTYSLDSTSRNKGITIDRNGVIQWTPTATQVGSHNIEVTVSDTQGGTASQTYAITVGTVATNNAPSITSTPVFVTGIGSTTYRYQVVATDSDAGDTLTYQLLSGPAGMTISSTTGLLTWTNPTAGTHQIVVGAVDRGGLGAAQRFTLTARANSNPVISSKAPDKAIPGTEYIYDVKATDPNGDALTYSLDSTSLGKGMTIDANGRLRWAPTTAHATASPHTVLITVSDGNGGSATEPINLTVARDTEAPLVRLIALNNTARLGENITFQARATDNVRVASLRLTVDGTPVILDANGIATVRASRSGTIRATAIATDTSNNTSTPVVFDVTVIDPNDIKAPTVNLDLEAFGDGFIKAPTDIRGTITDDTGIKSYRLIATPVDGGESKTIFEVDKSGQNIKNINGVLGKFDPSLLQNDSYTLRLEVEDIGGNISFSEGTVSVAGDLKLGNFRLSFTDLTVPVTGIPITLTRTYDTLTSGTSDDFGYGWRMEFRDTDLRTSVGKPSEEQQMLERQKPFLDGTKVYITLPGGKREAFTFRPKMVERLEGQNLGVFAKYFYRPEFVADKGGTSTLTVESNFIRKDNNSGEFYGYQGNPYNPADSLFGSKYILTTKEGVKYEIDALTGDLLTVTDTNGNKLTYTDGAITSSTGQKITFERDNLGRIKSVKDPMGTLIKYEYDVNGDLISVTDRENNVTRMEYINDNKRKHYLNKIIDPLGRTGIKNEYDEATGRLKYLEDVNGKFVEMTYEPNASRQIVKDQLGNPTIYEYDERGNILTEIDALGQITKRRYNDNNDVEEETIISDRSGTNGFTTKYTYDTLGNKLTEEDALGNITRYTYGDKSRLLTQTDVLGRTTTNIYDGNGNLRTTKDATGKITTYNYKGNDLLASVTDANGKVTKFDYYTSGNVKQVTDALNNVTEYTYNLNGDKLTEKRYMVQNGIVRELLTTWTYDKNGRMKTMTDALNHTTTYEYDNNGRQTAVIDALLRRTEYKYNDKGELEETIYPDNTPNNPNDNPREKHRYDFSGRKIETIDKAGRSTRFVYDKVGRLRYTVLPDDTPDNPNVSPELWDNPKTETIYYTDGLVKAQIEELGNRTEFRYDAAGRQIEIIYADDTPATLTDNPRTTHKYDLAGQRISSTDALNHTITFKYDDLRRLVKTEFHDKTYTTLEYDNLGRRIASVDQENKRTEYRYDDLGRLAGVKNALSDWTTYGYNEIGNLISVTDAEQHITRYEYDFVGRRTATILPMSQRSTMTYNAVGNLSTSTDFNGRTTTYTYDPQNRISQKLFVDGSKVTYTYTPKGLQDVVTLVDASDQTTATYDYDYDARDRQIKRTDTIAGVNRSISYTYDAASNRTSVTTASGTVNYTFDVRNRLDKVLVQGVVTADYDYDAVSNLIRTTFVNGTQEIRQYDDLNRLKYLENRKGNIILSSYKYTLDKVGNRRKVEENTGRIVEYIYDDLYRLTEEKITDTVNGNRVYSYTYDKVSNRKTKTEIVNGVTKVTEYAYDANDRLENEKVNQQIVVGYIYDNQGNTLTKTENGATTEYTWDYENRLIAAKVKNAGGVTQQLIQYRYNDNGIRVASTVNGVETRYLIDEVQPVAQVLEEYSPSGTVLVNYVYGNDLISQQQGNSRTFYHVDGLGSTRVLTDAMGTIVSTYNYETFGKQMNSTGSVDNKYLFAGEQYDSALGDYYNRARYYDADTGRFTRKDTYEGKLGEPVTLHKYIYANANPVSFTDPSGLFGMADISAANSIRDILAGMQMDAGGYLISATIKKGDYGLGDFVTDLAWNAGLSFAPMLLQKGISKAFRVLGDALQVDKAGIAENVARGLIYSVDESDIVSRFTIRQFGEAIADSPVATATYSRMRELGVDIRLNFTDAPRSASGLKVVGEQSGSIIDLYMQNARNAKQAVEYLVHEGVHAEKYAQFGFRTATRYEEYLAFRRQLLFAYGRKPTLQERREIWDFINQAYADLPVGKSPF